MFGWAAVAGCSAARMGLSGRLDTVLVSTLENASFRKERIMKVVLFCGGLGLRIRDAEDIPKPMVKIGYRPILWHLMRYYAHFGHKDFILSLGYRGYVIKNYFVNYFEYLSNDFVLVDGGMRLELFNKDVQDWRITFVDAGINSNIGQRLKAAENYFEGQEESLANYSHVLTNLPLPQQLDHL